MALSGEAKVGEIFPSLAALIEHPDGLVLFDTGYSDLFYQETRGFPFSLYARLTPVEISESETLRAQLHPLGILPSDIAWIVISHFHADHIAALRHFPRARFVVTRAAAEHFKSCTPIQGLLNAYLPALLPPDFWERCLFLEDTGKPIQTPPFGASWSWLSDDRLRVLPLPGHAAGHVGLWVDGRKVLIGDACWLRESFEQNRLPSRLTRPFVHDWEEMKQTVGKLHRIHQDDPSLELVPSHCLKTLGRLNPTHRRS